MSKLDKNRLNHSLSVARKMVEIGKKYNLKDKQLEEIFIIGYNHDIGYEFTNNRILHNKIGGLILKQAGFKHWKEIYYHGNPNSSYHSLYLDILNQADMQIDKFGNEVGYEKRLLDIKNRYKETSEEYQNSKRLIETLIKNRKS